jgi:hypothetical protein
VRASQIISIVGAVLVLGAFGALQFRLVGPMHRGYLVANILGSGALAVAAAIEGLWAFVALNTIWGVVSLRSFVVSFTSARNATTRRPGR